MLGSGTFWGWTQRLTRRWLDPALIFVIAFGGLWSVITDGHLAAEATGVAVYGLYALGIALQVAGAVPLWWRRSRPLEVLGLVLVFTFASLVLIGHASSLAVAVAIYSVSAYGPSAIRPLSRAAAILVLALGLGAIWLAVTRLRAALGYVGEAIGLAVFWLVGDYVRSRREFARGREAQRLVAAQDAERRRLERNLHDGAQQDLVALKVKVGLAVGLVEKDPAHARVLLEEVKGSADAALDALRQLSRGLNPPVLVNQGLAAALEAQAVRSGLPVTVEAAGLGRYPEAVEAAVYYCCSEALQNVAKHAHAGQAIVQLEERQAELRFRVADDGAGVDVGRVRQGSGIRNMADRMTALGGSLEVSPAPGGGTEVTGRVPLANQSRGLAGDHLEPLSRAP